MSHLKNISVVLFILLLLGLVISCGGGSDVPLPDNNDDNSVVPETSTLGAAGDLFNERMASGASFDDAVKETVDYLEAQENVYRVSVSETKSTIEVEFTNGRSLLMFTILASSPEWQQVEESAPPKAKIRTLSEAAQLKEVLGEYVTSSKKTAVIFAPYQADFKEAGINLSLIKEDFVSAGYEIAGEYLNEKATLMTLAKILNEGHGIYFIYTHGTLWYDGALCAGETISTWDDALALKDEFSSYTQIDRDKVDHIISFACISKPGISNSGRIVPTLSSRYVDYIKPLNNSLIILNACESLHELSKWDERSLQKGAGACVGWEKVVYTDVINKTMYKLCTDIKVQNHTLDDAVARLYTDQYLQRFSAHYGPFYSTINDFVKYSDGKNVVINPSSNFAPAELYIASSSSLLPQGKVNEEYSAALYATGGTSPYTWSLASGALHRGLTLNSSGLITGIPDEPGTKTFAVKVTDGASNTYSKTLSITVTGVSIVPCVLPGATKDVAYSYTLVGEGGVLPYTWEIDFGGTLHAGLALTNSTISGIPIESGTKEFSVLLTDSRGSYYRRALSLTVNGITITTASLTDGTVSTAYNYQLERVGNSESYTWELEAGLLPGGLTLSADGAITGTPLAAGTSVFTVRVIDGNAQSDSKELSLTINEVTISTASIPSAGKDRAYQYTLQVAGGIAPFVWALDSGTLPVGLSLSADGVISGTPTEAGVKTFDVRVTTANPKTVIKTFFMEVNVEDRWDKLAPAGGPPAARENHLSACINNKIYVFGGTYILGGNYNDLWVYDPVANTWTELFPPSSPPSLDSITANAVALNNKMYVINMSCDFWVYDPAANTWTEIITSNKPPMRIKIRITAINGKIYLYDGIDAGDLWEYNPQTNFWTELAPPGDKPTARHDHIVVSDSTKMYVFDGADAASGSVNDSWAYDPAANAWTDMGPYSENLGFVPPSNPILLNGAFYIGDTGIINIAVYSLLANSWIRITSDFDPLDVEIPALGDGYCLSGVNGKIYLFGGNIGMMDDTNSLWVYKPSLRISTVTVMNTSQNVAYNFALNAINGAGPYTWTLEAGSLPNGLVLNSNGTITGTPTESVTLNFTVRVTDITSASKTQSFWIKVNPAGNINTWAKKVYGGTPPPPICDYTASEIGGDIYVFGGNTNAGLTNQIWKYDVAGNTWSLLAPAGGPPAARYLHSASAIDGKIYIFGGRNGATYYNDLWAYDPVANTWTSLAPAGGPPAARYEHGAIAISGKMYVYGGSNTVLSQVYNDLWVYDPAANTWTELAPIGGPPPLADLSATGRQAAVVINGKMYLVSNRIWIYDPGANTWTEQVPTGEVPPTLDSKMAGSVVLLNGKIYLCEGRFAFYYSGYNDLWEYNTATNIWAKMTPGGPRLHCRARHYSFIINGKMFIFGGFNGNNYADGTNNDLWEYTP